MEVNPVGDEKDKAFDPKERGRSDEAQDPDRVGGVGPRQTEESTETTTETTETTETETTEEPAEG